MKELLKTKTFWVGILSILGGVVSIAFDETSAGIEAIILGLLAITGRDAVRKAAK